MSKPYNPLANIDFYDGFRLSADISDELVSPFSRSASVDFSFAWVGPDTNIRFGDPDAGLPRTISVTPSDSVSSLFGYPSLINKTSFLEARGVFSALAFGQAGIINSQRVVIAKGFDSLSISSKSVVYKFNQEVVVSGWSSLVFGSQRPYNLLQYLRARGFEASLYGQAYLQGGVRFLAARPFSSNAFGVQKLVNTTADQTIKTTGINSLIIPIPSVSPRMLYAVGLDSLSMGVTHDVRSPVIMPKGFVQSEYGKTTVWYHTRPLATTGFESYDTGYPKVFDPTRFVAPALFNRSSVFGDTAIRNKSVIVKPYGFLDGVVTPWAVIESNKRYYSPLGIKSQAFGAAFIENKTPSVFVVPIKAPLFNTPSIAYRIRSVKVSGFDRLALGNPLLIKTPELSPRGIAPPTASNSTIWYKNRSIGLDEKGFDSAVFGRATTWFRYRYVGPISWSSSAFSSPAVTHGVRYVIANSFIRDAYGNAWVSRGTRLLEPNGFHQENASNHMVGGTRQLAPYGFIATKWGTRIIPESQTAFTTGFAGKFGLAGIGLYTRYLRAIGYISIGTQPQDRWGAQKLYNKRQYIRQDFEGASGLTPPKWSDWQSIENRNRGIGATGFNSQKFGYLNTDNNAASLLPIAIAPPTRNNFSMVAFRVRSLAVSGISSPLMSTWGVVYNAARVLLPKGSDQSVYGYPDSKNTRRYYNRVGAINSQSYGVPAIGFRIRTIEIEKRYSIAPPIIRLPTVDLYTRYATFRGFETAAYGLPSLSIHFNNIAPRWVHRNSQGEPRVYNNTPELGVYGHDSQEYGAAQVRTQWREVYTRGDTATLFGRNKIADTKQGADIRGWRDTLVSQKHTVVKTGAPPYSEQQISLDGYMDFSQNNGSGEGGYYVGGNGIYFNEGLLGIRIPKPGINQNVVYSQGFEPLGFGDTKIHSNNIKIDVGIAIHNMSKNTMVSNSLRVIRLQEDDSISSKLIVGNPRLSPWTIYAVVEAPQQAISNHTSKGPSHYVNSDAGRRTPGFIVGMPMVQSTIRSLYHQSSNSLSVGVPLLKLARHIIKPKSFGTNRVGVPAIPFTLQSITTFNKKEPLTVFGEVELTIAERKDRVLSLVGISPKGFSAQKIELLDRVLLAKGYLSQSMGSIRYGDKPYMWQGLRVGEHIPSIIGAGDTSIYGDTMISLRVREVSASGFDAFISAYTPSSFKDRMTIKLASGNTIPETRRITTVGFVASNYSNADIKFGQYFIRPDGNSDQFRKGGYHA